MTKINIFNVTNIIFPKKQVQYDFGGLYFKSRQFAVAVGTATADTNHLTHPFHIEPKNKMVAVDITESFFIQKST